MKRLISVMALLVLVLSVNLSSADDFSNAISLVSTNAPAGADVAGMGNVWASLPDFSSNNPATYAAGEEKTRGSVTGTYMQFGFKDGPRVNSYTLTPHIKLPIGAMKLSLTSANSNTAATPMGVDMKYDSYSAVNIGYGLKVAEKVFLGIDVTPYSKSALNFSVDGQGVARSESKSYAFGGGMLYQPVKGVNVGAYYNYGRSKDKDVDLVANESSDSKATSQLLRVGASWQVLPMTLLAADWQSVNLDGFKKNQLFAGIEQGIIKDFLYLYTGWAANGPTVGVGMYFKSGGLNISYMSNPFTEANEYLGKSQALSTAIYWNF